MPVVPVPPTIEVGVSDTTELNLLRDCLRFCLSPPIAELRQTVLQTLTTATATAITFTTEDVDTDVDGVGGHDNVTNNTRFTARYAGWYLVSGGVVYAVNATGPRYAWWRVNGTDVNGSTGVMNAFASNFISVQARTKLLYLNINDYVELIGYHEAGSNLDTAVSARNQSTMSVGFVSL